MPSSWARAARNAPRSWCCLDRRDGFDAETPDETCREPVWGADMQLGLHTGSILYTNLLTDIRVAHDIVEAIKRHKWDGTDTGRAGLDIIQKDV